MAEMIMTKLTFNKGKASRMKWKTIFVSDEILPTGDEKTTYGHGYIIVIPLNKKKTIATLEMPWMFKACGKGSGKNQEEAISDLIKSCAENGYEIILA